MRRFTAVLLLLIARATTALAATVPALPGDNLRDLVASLQPGDVLELGPGDYDPDTSGYGTIRITDQNGDRHRWFTIRGAGARLLARSDECCNVIEIRDSSYWRFEGFSIDGRGGQHVDGIKTTSAAPDPNQSYAHHIEIAGVTIHNFHMGSSVGISTKCATWKLLVQDCRIYDLRTGLYLGNSDGFMPAMDVTLERNFIGPTGGYGCQLKHQAPRVGVAAGVTTTGSAFRDNVFIREAGATTDYRPCLFAGGTPQTGPGSDDLNVIEGNAILGNPEDAGIQVGGGNVRIVNNLVFGVVDGNGIRIADKDEGAAGHFRPQRVELVNNTIYKEQGGPRALWLQGFDTSPGLVQLIANNAVYRSDAADPSVSIQDTFAPGAVFTSNVFYGTLSGPAAGFTLSTVPPAGAFVNPTEAPGLVDLYPVAGSPLEDAADPSLAPPVDFNATPRPLGDQPDIGAYERDPAGAGNPGWQVGSEPKPPVTVALYRTIATSLDPLTPDRSTLWGSLGPPAWVGAFVSGEPDPEAGILDNRLKPLAGYRIDGTPNGLRVTSSNGNVVISFRP